MTALARTSFHTTLAMAVAFTFTVDAHAATKLVMTDQAITDKIEDEIIWEPGVSTMRVDVSTEDGIVTLTGTVNNLLAKERAIHIAETVKGVRAVIDKGQADDVASRVNGVLTVKNHLGVDPDTPAYSSSPYWDACDFNDYYWYHHKPTHAAKTDAEIEEDIESEFWWSPFVNSNDITVEVEDGVATLTGEVASLGERDTAADNARQGGARWVNNEIVLQLN